MKMKKKLKYLVSAWGLSPSARGLSPVAWRGLSPLTWRGLSPVVGLAMFLMAALAGCGGQTPGRSWGQTPGADGWERCERDFEAARSEYRQRLHAANTTVEISDAASFGWSRLEDLLSRVAALRVASGESAAAVEKEIAALKSKALIDGEKESAQFEGGSMAIYAGGIAANEEVAEALSEMLAARKEKQMTVRRNQ